MTSHTNQPARKKLPFVQRKSLGEAPEDWVEVRPFFTDKPFPTLVTTKVPGLSLVEWAATAKGFIQSLWEEKRAVLFRGFDLGGIPGYTKFLEITGDGPCLPYLDRSTPRIEYGPNIYCTTIYPAQYRIRLHNEGDYWTVHAQKAFFSCITPPETGGETPICDVHAVYNRIDPEIREEFAAKKWMLLRNHNNGVGMTWQEAYQTEDRAEVERYCTEHRIEFEWLEGDHLRTRRVRTPILAHPRTGELIWHNHLAFFHVSSRGEELQEALRGEYADDELPTNTFYGDGTPISEDVIRHINDAFDAELIMFSWQEGDLHLIDNIRIAHARQPFTGERLILVALKELYVPPDSANLPLPSEVATQAAGAGSTSESQPRQ